MFWKSNLQHRLASGNHLAFPAIPLKVRGLSTKKQPMFVNCKRKVTNPTNSANVCEMIRKAANVASGAVQTRATPVDLDNTSNAK